MSPLQSRFTEPAEFVEDLGRDVELVERGIVRVSKVARAAMQGTITRVTVQAGAIVAGRPVILERFVGDLWGTADDDQVQFQAIDVVKALERGLVALGLEVRAGVIEERDA